MNGPASRMSRAVIAVVGVGKSQLAIELAKACNGQVINGDSMQFFEGLDVISNKVPPAEQAGVPHHLMSFQTLQQRNEYVVGHFKRDADRIISQLHRGGKVPVLAGGTHYFTQSLLFENHLVTCEPATHAPQPYDEALLERPTPELLQHLRQVDPVIAGKWHPNDRRKIRRSLQIFLETGRRASDIYQEQQKDREAAVPLSRYPVCIFWVSCDPAVLEARLDKRVQAMLDAGLIREIKDMYEVFSQLEHSDTPPDIERGAWQAIGFKEFLPWLRDGCRDDALFATCLEAMSTATKRYARQQVRWIRNRLVQMTQTPENEAHLYILDATDLAQWHANVREIAIDVATKFLAGEALPDPRSVCALAADMIKSKEQFQNFGGRSDMWKTFECDICQDKQGQRLVLVGQAQWDEHLTSRHHRNRQRSLAKHNAFLEWKRVHG